ncbi:MAG: peptidoglycan editing factor PgeF [Gammaproteobacteria bacterium]|nr:peptidoglycan editing factor PgeF [Gammaproteobacteria bacterium]
MELIRPDWLNLENIEAFTTTRAGGLSLPPYDSLNLGLHSGDDESTVRRNRQRLQQSVNLASDPAWLRQTHGIEVCDDFSQAQEKSFDAAWTDQPGQVLVILTADCLPVVFTNRAGSEIALAHAGWRGLADGVLRTTVERFSSTPAELSAWLGPAIGPDHFEVGDEVRQRFLDALPDLDVSSAFVPGKAPGKWYGDLYKLATLTLNRLGVQDVSGGHYCTYADSQRFFSYRRDGASSGRMATLCWIKK